MCGICGQFNFATGAPVHVRDIERMAGTIVHRGPDDEGYHIDGPLGLGFRRLSIIDLANGHQPMSDPEESVWIVFNGEIYNFHELRQELEGHGWKFRTNCDTEVILYGYKQWGNDVFNHLNGMFGVAIWDARVRKLILARDPFGIKLVYYKIERGQLYFGSELRPVLAAVQDPVEIDANSISMFLRYRFTPSPHTLYQGIRKLAPGTMLVTENGSCREKRWYNYTPEPFPDGKSVEEAQEELTELYRRAMKRHLLSDVPVGLLLSGGMDSGLLLALMNLYGKSWQTYTVGYGSSFADDELTDAEETAALFSARHTSVQLDRGAFEQALTQIVSCLEEPIASSSIVPMYFVCQRARQDVKVALMGQGPDELFGGYKRHLGVRYGSLWARLPAWVRHPAAAAVRTLPRSETLKRGVNSLDVADRMERYQEVLSLLPGEMIHGLFRDDVLTEPSNKRMLDCWRELDPLSSRVDEFTGFQFVELRSTLPDELLMYADKLSMAHSLEVRVPYLDREVVEYAERLPANLKVRNGSRKWLHRRVCRTLLPEAVVNRKKRGFAVNVVDDWLRHAVDGGMKEMLLDSSSRIYQFLNPKAVQELFHDHHSGKHDNHKVLFSLVVLEQWLRQSRTSIETPVALD